MINTEAKVKLGAKIREAEEKLSLLEIEIEELKANSRLLEAIPYITQALSDDKCYLKLIISGHEEVQFNQDVHLHNIPREYKDILINAFKEIQNDLMKDIV